MSEQPISFKYASSTKGDDNLIRQYHLEVTDSRTGKIEMISVEPRDLVSARSLKRILLGRCMFYTATRSAHDQMLLALFDPD
ncbi:MAG: hypothetical protein ACN6O6_21385 [Pseudomonas sp.]|uniref:hypothetical protein n=1 Tax=Pseudomonas sp. TaxID=306 RepID=UPI003D0F0F04